MAHDSSQGVKLLVLLQTYVTICQKSLFKTNRFVDAQEIKIFPFCKLSGPDDTTVIERANLYPNLSKLSFKDSTSPNNRFFLSASL